MPHVNQIGFTLLSGSDGASGGPYRVNIVFVHGLRGHARYTWEDDRADSNDQTPATPNKRNIRHLFKKRASNAENANGESSPRKLFWPEEYLAQDIPEARVWTYGYNSEVIGVFQANNKNSVSQHGQDLAAHVEREIENEDPIVFVAHSLGGIIVKDALHKSDACRTRTKAIIFLGTPHRGSKLAGWGEVASNLARLGLQDSNKKIVQTLEVNDEVLANIHEEFKTIVHESRIKIYSFQEARGISGMKGLHNKVVEDFSSKVDLPRALETVETIDANHMQMARCGSRADPAYHTILGVLKQFIRGALDGTKPTDILLSISNVTLAPAASTATSSNETHPGANVGILPSHRLTTTGWTVLHAAVNNKSIEGVTAILAMGFDPNVQTEGGWTPLWVGACHGLLEISRLLLEAGANVNVANRQGVTPLKEAAQIGALELVQLLIENGANVELAPHENRDTPLIVASAKNHLEVVRLLLALGANSRAQQSGGWSPLHYALLNKNKEMAILILGHGPDINSSTRVGLRPLHLAALAGFADICAQLLDLGAEMEATDSGGVTALRAAVQAGQLETVKLLVERGSRTDVVGEDGHTLSEVALISGHVSVYQYLEEQTTK